MMGMPEVSATNLPLKSLRDWRSDWKLLCCSLYSLAWSWKQATNNGAWLYGCTQNVPRRQQFHVAPAVFITRSKCLEGSEFRSRVEVEVAVLGSSP